MAGAVLTTLTSIHPLQLQAVLELVDRLVNDGHTFGCAVRLAAEHVTRKAIELDGRPVTEEQILAGLQLRFDLHIESTS